MKRKVFKCLIIVCISLFLISSIAGTLVAAEKKVKIGIAFASLESEFWQSMKGTAIEQLEKLGVDTTVVSAEDNITKQMAQVEDLITKKVDAIILVAVDAEAIVPIVNVADEEGIPLITLNRAISEKARDICFVGSDNVLAGKMAARYIAEKLNGKGKVVILNGPPETLNARLRNEGFVSGLSEYPDIEISTQKWGLVSRSVSMNYMEDILTTFKEVDAVLTYSDFHSTGAADAIISRNLQNQIIIGSIDGTEEVARLMLGKNYPIIVTIAQDPKMMAKWSVLVAYEAAIGNKVPVIISTWLKGITPDNAEEYLSELSE